ncbi:beta-lactamase/transpeptidase-like protein [Rhexocercosporidium sp. MPI-PUGE-AT-0058]|nr:beta-lactamase/transpeptidase-like protein [Rhexocercosporidium sp. MPI-PUGE-AT-0058]
MLGLQTITLLAFAISQPLVDAATTETFLGPAFPIPQNLCNDPTIKTANQDFLTLLTTSLETGSSIHGEFDNSSTAFSFEFYSANTEEPVFQYHYSAPILEDAELGVKTVDRDTIYRIGSITKLLTVYTFLITDGDVHFNDLVTKYIPELLAGRGSAGEDPVHRIAWDEVTLGSLASHMAGVGSTYGWLDISLADFDTSDLNLPPLTQEEKPTCGGSLNRVPCPEDEFLKGFASRDPIFPTFQTPIYSNSAFQILALALARITGRDFKTIVDEELFRPLNLSRTSYEKPDDSLGVIPGDANTTFWNFEIGSVWPTGGAWSSTADLSTIGRSILSSQILSPSLTRRWMKPVTHTASLRTSIGAPWEIQRVVLPASGRVVDLYTKSGKLGVYGGYMILVPDYDVGFTLLQAGAGLNTDVMAGFVVDVFLPALEKAARLQAMTVFTGEYEVETEGVNSTFTLSSSEGQPGLILTNWINNGSLLHPLIPILIPLAIGDIETASATLQRYKDGFPLIDPESITINLYPTGLRTPSADGGEIVAFRAGFDIISEVEDTSPFADGLSPWSIADVFIYGNKGLDEFLFKMDGEGRVVGVENPFLRLVFGKV